MTATKTKFPAFHELAEELQRASAAFRVDALHNRMTGAVVVLDEREGKGQATDNLADMLQEAGEAMGTLLAFVDAHTKELP